MRYTKEERNIIERVEKWISVLIYALFYLEVFLVPLFFIPKTLEFYDTSKVIFIALINLTLLLLIGIRSALSNEIKIFRTSFDGIFFLLILILLLSSLFSFSPAVSFLGYFGRGYDTLIMFVSLMSFVYIFLNVIKNEVQIDYLIVLNILSSIILSLFFIETQHQIVPSLIKSFPIIFQSSFSPIIDSMTLPYYMVFSMLFAFTLLASGIRETVVGSSKVYKLGLGAIGIIISALIIGISSNNWIPILILIICAIYFLYFSLHAGIFSKKDFQYIVGAFLIAPLLSLALYLFVNGHSSPATLSFSYGISILHGVFRDIKGIFIGTGPDTFYFDFIKNIDPSYYVSNQYSIIFSKAPTEALQIVLTLGVTGIITFMLLFISALYTAYRLFRSISDQYSKILIIFAGALILAFIIMFFTQTGSVSLYFPLFLALAVLTFEENVNSLTQKGFMQLKVQFENHWDTKNPLIKNSLFLGLLVVPIICILLISIHYSTLVMYYRSINDGNVKSAYNDALYSASKEPFIDYYQNQLSITGVEIAQVLSKNKKTSETSIINDFISQSVNKDQYVLLNNSLNPSDLLASINLMINIYRNVDNNKAYIQSAIQSGEYLNTLYPGNISYMDTLAQLYYMNNNNDKALTELQKVRAINTSDSSYNYDYALALEANGKYAEAIPVLKDVRDSIIDKKSDLYKHLVSEISIDTGKEK